MIADLILQGVTIVVVVFFGLHLRQKLQTLQTTVTAQEKTIAAQEPHMKAQSTVLQDFERLNQMMKLVIDTVSDPAALQREQAFRERVERDAAAHLREHTQRVVKTLTDVTLKQFTEQATMVGRTAVDFIGMIGRAMAYIPPAERMGQVGGVDLDYLPTGVKDALKILAQETPYRPITTKAGPFALVGQWISDDLRRQESEGSPTP